MPLFLLVASTALLLLRPPRPASATTRLKLTGPAKTVAKWEQSFLTFLESLRVE